MDIRTGDISDMLGPHLVRMVERVLEDHPLPWVIDRDWCYEVHSSDGKTVAKYADCEGAEALIELAEYIVEKNKSQLDGVLREMGIDPTGGERRS